jgi:cell division protein FtsI (penicillin-binding protein 3)
MHIASFAGIAPVNNPVIAVAVVIDTPTKGDYHGASVSAPVFAEVAQQVLEYLAVAHDIDLRMPRAAAAKVNVAEDDEHEQGADINALFAAANDLPSDDPQRASSQDALRAQVNQPAANSSPAKAQQVDGGIPAAAGKTSSSGSQNLAKPQQSAPQPATIVVAVGKTMKVPSLIGLPVRKVIEQAAAAGLEVEVTGSGSVREQAPVAGTMVAPGTKIVVRCGR